MNDKQNYESFGELTKATQWMAPADEKELDEEVKTIVNEQVVRNIDSGEALAKLSVLCGEMYERFQSKPVGTAIGGFFQYSQWWLNRMEPLRESMRTAGKVSTGFYYARIGRKVVPLIGQSKVVELRIEKCKALLPMAEAKNEISTELLEYAEKNTADNVRLEVDRRLFKGNPSHAPGPGRTYKVNGPEESVLDLMDDLNYGRQVEFGDGPSDAEILHLMVMAYRQEREHENAQEHARLAGFANAQQHAWYRLLEYTASLKAKVTMRQDFGKFTIDLKHAIMQDICKEFKIPWESVSPVPQAIPEEP